MDATLFFSFNVSKIFFLIFRFSMCFCCSSDSIIFLAMCFLRHFIPCLIDNFTDANVGIKPSSLHFVIKSSLLLQCFLIGFSKFFVIFSISYPCFSLRTHRIAEPTFTNMYYQGLTSNMYKSTSRDEQIRVNESYREEQNNAVERSQQKQRENTNTNKDNINSSTREKIDNLKKDLKYMKETLKSITSRQ